MKVLTHDDPVFNDGDIIRYDLFSPFKYSYFILRNFEYTQVGPDQNVNRMTWNVWLYPLAITSDDSNKEEIELKIMNSEIEHLCAAKKCFAPPFHPNGRKNKYGWKIIGNKKLGNDELSHPWARGNTGMAQLFAREQWDSLHTDAWYVFQIEDCPYSFGALRYKQLFLGYDRIKHLTLQEWHSADILKYLMTFLYMINNGMNISDHFDVSGFILSDPYLKATYYQTLNTVLYKDILKEYWNTIIPE